MSIITHNINCLQKLRFCSLKVIACNIIALHGMQTRSSDENSVCLSGLSNV